MKKLALGLAVLLFAAIGQGQSIPYSQPKSDAAIPKSGGPVVSAGGDAPDPATTQYVLCAASSEVDAEVVPGTGVCSWLVTPSSANLITAITDETGTGSLVFSIAAALTGAVTLGNGSTTAGTIGFKEDSDNGTNVATLIGPASTADVTITLPAATDTLVGKATTDILTNKSFNDSVAFKLGATSGGRITLYEDSDNGSNFTTTGGANSQSGDYTVLFQAPTANTFVATTGANAWESDINQTFNPGSTNAGINVGTNTGVPSALAVGDLFYDDTAYGQGIKTKNAQGTTVTLGGGGGVSRKTQELLFNDFNETINTGPVAISSVPFRCIAGTGTGPGCITPSGATVDASHPGVWGINSGTSASGDASIGTTVDQLITGGEVFETWVQMTTITTATGVDNDYATFFGLCDTLNETACTNGVGFYTTHADSGAFWHIITIADSVSTATDVASNTAPTYSATAWHKLRFEINSNLTSVAFYVDDVQLNVSPLTANIPPDFSPPGADAMAVLIKIYNGAATNHVTRQVGIDYMYYVHPVTR